jgi:hypothetical protein
METELIKFVATAMGTGVVGSATYEGVKLILETSFNKLSNFIKNKEIEKFNGALEMILENEKVKEALKELMNQKNVTHLGVGNIIEKQQTVYKDNSKHIETQTYNENNHYYGENTSPKKP